MNVATQAEDGLLTRSLGLNVKAIREDSRECDFVASTDAIDRDNEVVEQDFQLEDYRKNPVVLYAHDRWDLPIGQCSSVGIKNGQLECTIKFASAEANPKAEQVWQCVREKVLRAVSVGFRSKDYRYEKRDGRDCYVLSGNSLYEISVTPIPANPEALAKSKSLARERANTKGGMADPKESTMDLEKQLAQANEKTLTAEKALAVAEEKARESAKAFDALKAENESLKTDVAAKTKAIESVTTERDKACEELAVARKSIVTAKVDALVGKKFAPSERDVMLELALANETLFAKTIDARPDMKHTEQVIATDHKSAPPVTSDNGDALAALLEKSA